jgi:hypothetical protein
LEEKQANREAEKARIHAAWEAEERAQEAAAEASLKRAGDRLKRAWGRWQKKMYQARLARTAEPSGYDIALQQLWRQSVEARRQSRVRHHGCGATADYGVLGGWCRNGGLHPACRFRTAVPSVSTSGRGSALLRRGADNVTRIS